MLAIASTNSDVPASIPPPCGAITAVVPRHACDRTWKSELSFSLAASSAKFLYLSTILIDHVKLFARFGLLAIYFGCGLGSNTLDAMALNKRLDVEVLMDTWKAPNMVPAALTLAAQASPLTIDFLCALIFTALWTRPPIRYGFSLSDCWRGSATYQLSLLPRI